MTEIPMIDSFTLLKRQCVFHSFNEYYIYLVVHVPWGGRNAITESKESERRFIMLGQDGGPLDNIWGSLALDYYGQPLYIYNQKT